MSDDKLIYEPEIIEALARAGETDAHRYADAWLEGVTRTPEMATDRETVMSIFAVAIERGRDAGLDLTNDNTLLAIVGPILEAVTRIVPRLVVERFGPEARDQGVNIGIEAALAGAKVAGFGLDIKYDPSKGDR
jgi:hypothetical protein